VVDDGNRGRNLDGHTLMANKRKISITALFSLLAACAFAQTATTTPVGFINYAIPTGTASAPSRTSVYFSLTDTPASIAGALSGRLTGVTATTLSNSGANWTAGSLSSASVPYFVRITSGTAEGMTLQVATTTANTATTLTVLNNGVDLSSVGIVVGGAGDTYEVFPADTLATFFGTNLPVRTDAAAATQLVGGPNAAAADLVSYWTGSSWLNFYYDTVAGYWRRDIGGTTQNNTVVRPDTGFLITRKGPAMTLTLTGRAPASDMKARYQNTGSSLVGLFPITKTLQELNLQSLPGWTGAASSNGNNVATADKVLFWSGSSWMTFYFDTSSSNWRRTPGGALANSTTIQTPERPFMIQKISGGAGSSFITQQTPY
jgi:uncharacterized protein (TIGR02597 family)